MNIQQPTLVVSGNHDVIVHTVNSLYLVQNMPNAKLILYPDANHGSWYENHEDCAFEANRFLNDSDRSRLAPRPKDAQMLARSRRVREVPISLQCEARSQSATAASSSAR